jgi:hypothetical protein
MIRSVSSIPTPNKKGTSSPHGGSEQLASSGISADHNRHATATKTATATYRRVVEAMLC